MKILIFLTILTIFTIFYNVDYFNICSQFWQLTTIFTIQTIAFAILTIENTILETCDIQGTALNSVNLNVYFLMLENSVCRHVLVDKEVILHNIFQEKYPKKLFHEITQKICHICSKIYSKRYTPRYIENETHICEMLSRPACVVLQKSPEMVCR